MRRRFTRGRKCHRRTARRDAGQGVARADRGRRRNVRYRRRPPFIFALYSSQPARDFGLRQGRSSSACRWKGVEGDHLLIVLTGIDGSGKTTAARALVSAALAEGRDALLLSNYAGRRRMSLLSAKFGVQLPPKLADAVESTIRAVNVLVSHARASRFPGLTVMDRHLHCQLALRQARGLPRGRVLPLLLRMLRQPDLVIYLDVDPERAHERIVARGTDEETLADLTSLRDAYRSLPEFTQFTVLDADASQADVLAELTRILGGAPGGRCQSGEPQGLVKNS